MQRTCHFLTTFLKKIHMYALYNLQSQLCTSHFQGRLLCHHTAHGIQHPTCFPQVQLLHISCCREQHRITDHITVAVHRSSAFTNLSFPLLNHSLVSGRESRRDRQKGRTERLCRLVSPLTLITSFEKELS